MATFWILRHVQKAIMLMIVSWFVCSMPGSSGEPVSVGPPVVDIPVFFATDRETITSNTESLGSKLGQLTLGCAKVTLPVNKGWQNSISLDLNEKLKNLGWVIDPTRSTTQPFIEARGYVAEPSPEKVLFNVQICPDFWEQLAKQANISEDKCVYVYIHGFASSGNNAVYSGGILSAEVEAPVVVFTWPSVGTAGLKPFRLLGKHRIRALYQADRKMIDEPQVLSDLTTLLSDLRAHMAPEVKVNLIAHSLGNRLLARYLASDADDKFDRVYFLAADIDQRLFFQALEKLRAKARYTAVFMNPQDRVLKISAANDLLNMRITKKLGQANFSVPNVEFVNYKEIAQPTGADYLRLKHYVPFEDFGSIIRGEILSPKSAGQNYFLVKRTQIEKMKGQPKKP